MDKNITALIDGLQLKAHPEGGYFKETYRSQESIPKNALPQRFNNHRSFGTSIYFLLEQNNFSAFHRIKSDEIWHFYVGDTLHIHIISEAGAYQLIQLGNHIHNGETFQAMVPAGSWFASEIAQPGHYALVGCTVAPGFDFADFELAKKETLVGLFPNHELLINRLCR